jgi:hypothetical protein
MGRLRRLSIALTIAILVGAFCWGNPLLTAHAQPVPPSITDNSEQITIPANQVDIMPLDIRSKMPLTRAQQLNIINRLTFAPSRVSQRIRVLRVVNAFDEKDRETQRLDRPTAYAIVFNYTRSVTERFLVDVGTGEVLREEVLLGRPQPSVEERLEAARILQTSSELRPILEAGAVLEGGFAVAGPLGAPPTNRYIQMQVLSVDRSSMLRMVTVDLTTSTIVATSNLS